MEKLEYALALKAAAGDAMAMANNTVMPPRLDRPTGEALTGQISDATTAYRAEIDDIGQTFQSCLNDLNSKHGAALNLGLTAGYRKAMEILTETHQERLKDLADTYSARINMITEKHSEKTKAFGKQLHKRMRGSGGAAVEGWGEGEEEIQHKGKTEAEGKMEPGVRGRYDLRGGARG